VLLALVAAALAYALSGVRVIGPAERGVVQRFGRALEVQATPGVHVGLPVGIERLTRATVHRTRRVTVGSAAADRILGGVPAAEDSQFITGDRNLVEIRMSVQYVMRDPLLYLFAVADPDVAVRHVCEAALSDVLCGTGVDAVLTLQRSEVLRRVQDQAQELLDRMGVGVQLLAVTQERTAPPEAVADAFRAVTDAKADRERLLAEAEGYREDLLPRARGEAAAILEQAQADAYAMVTLARAEADRFTTLSAEVAVQPDLARRRLHAEAVEESLRRSRTIVADPKRAGPVRLVEEGP